MEENQRNQQVRSHFDNMMFGMPRQSISEKQEEQNNQNELEGENKTNNQTNQTEENSKTVPEIDFIQMAQQFDELMGYVNKLSPSLKKLEPLMDLLKGFGGSSNKK